MKRVPDFPVRNFSRAHFGDSALADFQRTRQPVMFAVPSQERRLPIREIQWILRPVRGLGELMIRPF